MNRDLFVAAFRNPAGSPIRELFPYLSRPGVISFAGGYPSPALLDAEGLSAAAAEVFANPSAALQYGPTEGDALLKEELIRLSADRAVTCTPDQLLVTTGSQQAFDLLVRVLVQPGDPVLVEVPAYPAALQALRLAGARIMEVPMDAQGLQIEPLRGLLESLPAGSGPKLLYTVPNFSNPRGSLMPTVRRQALVALARQHGFLIVEDDAYGELIFSGELPRPIHALAAQDGSGDNPVLYLSSLSKTVAPALRIGWMVGPTELVRRCAIAKQTVDLCTSPIAQRIAASYLRGGRYRQTVIAARDEYGRRVRAMAEALRSQLGDRLHFHSPSGGMFLWAEVAGSIAPGALFEAAVEQGVLFVPGAAFHPGDAPRPAMRLSFATPPVDAIVEGVSRLTRAFDSAPHS